MVTEKLNHKQDDVILDWQDLVIARVHPAHSLNAEMAPTPRTERPPTFRQNQSSAELAHNDKPTN